MRLLTHAQPLHQRRGGDIARVGAAIDPVELQRVKGEAEHGRGRLGGIAASPVVRVEDKSDLTLAMLHAAPPENDLADHAGERGPGTGQSNGQGKDIILGHQAGLFDLPRERGTAFLEIEGIAVEISGHIGSGPDGVELVQVRRHVGPEHQPGGGNRRLDRQHRA